MAAVDNLLSPRQASNGPWRSPSGCSSSNRATGRPSTERASPSKPWASRSTPPDDFRSILDSKLKDDEVSITTKARQRNSNATTSAQPASASASAASRKLGAATFPIWARMNVSSEIRAATKLDNNRAYYGQSAATTWTPGDFGQARMASLAWIYAFAVREQKAGRRP